MSRRLSGLPFPLGFPAAAMAKTPVKAASKSRGGKRPQADQSELDLYRVEAAPAKLLFLEVLTRDIHRTRAILDLVDNSVDGAIRLRGIPRPDIVLTATEKKRYQGLRIDLRCTPTEFSINDNCGGITVDVARHYAFRFGYDKSDEEKAHMPEKGSRIGLFGIGMKRALFKLGTEFHVESTTPSSHFVLDLNAEQWLKSSDWHMKFTDFGEKPAVKREVGTRVKVAPLHPAVRDDFSRPEYGTELLEEIQLALQEFLQRGLAMTVTAGKGNPKTVEAQAREAKLYAGAGITPFADRFSIADSATNGVKKPDVSVRMFVGVGDQSLADAGWYVFCNGRLIEGPGQDEVTGWGVEEPTRIPKYHNQFDRFYGFVYMDCDDPERLPWNSMKTGLAEDNDLYRGVRQRMILAMRPVIDMLNDRRKEEKLPAEVRVIEAALTSAKPVALAAVKSSEKFRYPEAPPVNEAAVTVKFTRPAAEIEVALRRFKVKKANRAAELAFEEWLRLTRGS